jgi:hypothetical protein
MGCEDITSVHQDEVNVTRVPRPRFLRAGLLVVYAASERLAVEQFPVYAKDEIGLVEIDAVDL